MELTLFGFTVSFESEDPILIRTAYAAYARWETADTNPVGPRIRLQLRPVDCEYPETVADIHVDGSQLTLSHGGLRAHADAGTRTGWCEVTPRLSRNPDALATELLDTLLLFIVTRNGRIPLHASAIMIGNTAAVLAGRSGSGKSTLALAAARAGLPVLSEDTVYVQLRPRFRIWGLSRAIHLLPGEATHLETSGSRLRGGRLKTIVPLSATQMPIVAEHAALFILRRGGHAETHDLSPEEAVRSLTAQTEPGFDHFPDTLPEAIAAIADNGAWRLDLSADPREALTEIRKRIFGVGNPTFFGAKPDHYPLDARMRTA